MICKHPSYHLVEGRLVCAVCGQPPVVPHVEDKIAWPQEIKNSKNLTHSNKLGVEVKHG